MNPNDNGAPRKGPRLILVVFGLGLAALVLPPLVLSFPLTRAAATCLPLGWWHFIKRNAPLVTGNWIMIISGVVFSLLAILIADRFLNWLLSKSGLAPRPQGPRRLWRWQWSLGLYALIWILFIIAFGAGGVMVHTSWLLNSNAPLYEERLYSEVELYRAYGTIRSSLSDSEDLEGARTSILAEHGIRGDRQSFCEAFGVILFSDANRRVLAYVIIPRDPRLVAQKKFAYSNPDGPCEFKHISTLPAVLSELEVKYSVRVSL